MLGRRERQPSAPHLAETRPQGEPRTAPREGGDRDPPASVDSPAGPGRRRALGPPLRRGRAPFVAEPSAPRAAASPRGAKRAAPPPPGVRYRPRASTRRRRARAGRGRWTGNQGGARARRAAGPSGAHLPAETAAPRARQWRAVSGQRRRRRPGRLLAASLCDRWCRWLRCPRAAPSGGRRPRPPLGRGRHWLRPRASAPGAVAAPRRAGRWRPSALGSGAAPEAGARSPPGWGRGVEPIKGQAVPGRTHPEN